MKIDFNELGMPVFTGRSRGVESRKRLGLDHLSTNEVVDVQIPAGVYTITSSYFLGLFGPSVRTAGSRERFLEQFRFVAPPHIEEKLGDLITRALREQQELFKGGS